MKVGYVTIGDFGQITHYNYTKSSAVAEGSLDTPQVQNITLEKACKRQ